MDNKAPQSSVDVICITSIILKRYWPVLGVFGLFVLVQMPVFLDWWKIWDNKESYYSHGPLVPLIAAFMIWVNQGRLAKAKANPCWWGVVLIVLATPIYCIGLLMGLRILYGITFFMFLFGGTLAFFGRNITKIVFVPLAFLITMMPLASWVLDAATADLQLTSATVAAKGLQLIYPAITQTGNIIDGGPLPGQLFVGSPCSGLRLLISLITFCWFFVYMLVGSPWKKAMILIMAFPLSIFINSLRITMIGLVGISTGSTEAMHTFHDYSGYIGLVICFFLLFGFAKLVKIQEFRKIDVPGAVALDASNQEKIRPVGYGFHGLIATLVLLPMALVSPRVHPLYDLPKGELDRSSVPMVFGDWIGSEVNVDDQTQEFLSKGDLMSVTYANLANGKEVNIFLDAALDHSAFHNPHFCLPGSGNRITEDRDLTLSFKTPRPIKVNASRLITQDDFGNSLMVIHWYSLGEKSFRRTPDVADDVRHHKMNDLLRIVTRPWDISDIRQDVLSRQYTWYRFTMPVYQEEDGEILEGFIEEFIANKSDFGK